MIKDGRNKVLVMQTAFIGDVVLSTSIAETINRYFPETEIHYLVRKGNESLLFNNPKISKIIVWDKKNGKYKSMLQVIKLLRLEKYSLVLNLQRFLSSGLIALFSGASTLAGFKKNPLSFAFNYRADHEISADGKMHEVERNFKLLNLVHPGILRYELPKLYSSPDDEAKVNQVVTSSKFITISPGSVWFTKQFPEQKWVDFLNALMPSQMQIYIIGGHSEYQLGETIIRKTSNKNAVNLCGKFGFVQSALLMKKAAMNYVNDSAPLHLASAMDAPVTAIFCSTVPGFGFGPLSKSSFIVQNQGVLDCRPCGLHGKRICPKGHFKCANDIDISDLTDKLR